MGFVAIADAFCHTDPSFALGLSLGLVHGFALADALARDELSSFYEDTVPELRERFELARDVSEVRLARLRGEQPTPTSAASTFAALNAAAADDPDLFASRSGEPAFSIGSARSNAGCRHRRASRPGRSPAMCFSARSRPPS